MAPLFGYLEGYYGRLLDWPARHRLLDTLLACGMNAWWYAPKEDVAHRLRWRDSFDPAFLERFGGFAGAARQREVTVIAGMAPGLDFDWRQIEDGPDLDCLVDKTRALVDSGADVVALLLDDIDDDFQFRAGADANEGQAHALLANALGRRLDTELIVVPRIYANELHAAAPEYLADFSAALDAFHAVSLCGSDVVAREITLVDCRRHLGSGSHRIIAWDNLYANDYCPGRLFLGPWSGRRGIAEVLLNLTGLPCTDALLLETAALARGEDASGAPASADTLRELRRRHGVPEAFDVVADCFAHPTFNPIPGEGDAANPLSAGAVRSLASIAGSSPPLADAIAALDELQWRWKSALSREWYPWLMALRHDLAVEAGAMAPVRIAKTRLAPLARNLLHGL